MLYEEENRHFLKDWIVKRLGEMYAPSPRLCDNHETVS